MMTYPCGRNFLEQELKQHTTNTLATHYQHTTNRLPTHNQHTTNTQLKHYQHKTSTGTLFQELTKKQK